MTGDPIGWNPEDARHRYWNPETGKVEDDRVVPAPPDPQDPRAPYRQIPVLGSLHLVEAPWIKGIEIRRGQSSVPIAFSELVDLIITLEDAKEWRIENAGS